MSEKYNTNLEAAAFLSPGGKVRLLRFVTIMLKAENLNISTENLSFDEILNLFDFISEENLLIAIGILEVERAKREKNND